MHSRLAVHANLTPCVLGVLRFSFRNRQCCKSLFFIKMRILTCASLSKRDAHGKNAAKAEGMGLRGDLRGLVSVQMKQVSADAAQGGAAQ